ncbi:MAG: aminotransferase class V-fold PLP-dependent enzyme [SAR202 cluster bacterium]|nr:aminotransferase class V-fold PLP-dependent enzyme [SAR202 cluster bacterium]
MIDIDAVRSKIPCLAHLSYLNMSYGPKPSPVVDEVVRLARLIETEGMFNPDVMAEISKMYERARDGTAQLLNVTSSEIALTRHVSEGMNIVASGLNWSPGDEVIISDEEHQGGSIPWMNLARRAGITVRLLHMSYDLDSLLLELDSLINARTRIVSLSHVSTRSGFLLPAKEITEFVHSRGVPIVLDGAHAVGLVPVDLKDIGCDFYSGCGHKWLLAPQGTGFLYVSKDRFEGLELTSVGANTALNWDLSNLIFDAKTDAEKFEYGTRDLTVYAGLSVALDLAEEVGIDNISYRSSHLAGLMKSKVADMNGFDLITPMDASVSTGIVAVTSRMEKAENLTDRLWQDHRILVTGKDQWVRISFPYFTLEEEVDRVAEAIDANA